MANEQSFDGAQVFIMDGKKYVQIAPGMFMLLERYNMIPSLIPDPNLLLEVIKRIKKK